LLGIVGFFVREAHTENIYSSSALVFISIGTLLFFGNASLDSIEKFFTTGISFMTVIYVLVYLSLGLVWSMFKWRKLVVEEFTKWKNRGQPVSRFSISFSRYKETIAFWVIWWVFSAIDYLIGDFIVDMISRMGKMYTRIAEKTINDLTSKAMEEKKDKEASA
jgi:hypothetical protein